MNKETISKINSIIRPDEQLISKTKYIAYNGDAKSLSVMKNKKIITVATFLFVLVGLAFLISEFEVLKAENIANIFENDKEISSLNQENAIGNNDLIYAEEMDDFEKIISNIEINSYISSALNVSVEKFEIKHVYQGISDMFKDDKIKQIVSGRVESVNTYIYKNVLYSEVVLRIEECFKGNIITDNTVTFVEFGGTIGESSASEFFSHEVNKVKYKHCIDACNGDFSKGFSVIYNMYTNSKKNDYIIVFLEEITSEIFREHLDSEKIYIIAGLCQGKFILTEDWYVPASCNYFSQNYKYQDFVKISKE